MCEFFVSAFSPEKCPHVSLLPSTTCRKSIFIAARFKPFPFPHVEVIPFHFGANSIHATRSLFHRNKNNLKVRPFGIDALADYAVETAYR
jgi:hypothetical protein